MTISLHHSPSTHSGKFQQTVAMESTHLPKPTHAPIMLIARTHPQHSPLAMLRIIAVRLGFEPSCFQSRSRAREVVDLRFLGAFVLRQYYPTITLKQIAGYFGGKDHSTVINAITRAQELLATGDDLFTRQYITAISAINLWLKETPLA